MDYLEKIDRALEATEGNAAAVFAGAPGDLCEALAGETGVIEQAGRLMYRGVFIQRRPGRPSVRCEF